MGRKCNLELRLSLASSVDDDDDDDDAACGGGEHKPQCLTSGPGPSANQHQWITILHNGQISVCDVTELQAKTIIWWASQCQTNRKKVNQRTKTYEDRRLLVLVQSIRRGLSIKKSLERFFQKRNERILSASPYYRR